MSNVKNIYIIGGATGAISQEFESGVPAAEEVLDGVICSREQFSYQSQR